MRTLSAPLPPNLHWPGSGPWSRPQKSTFLFGTSLSADWNGGPVNRARSVLSQALPLWWEVWGGGERGQFRAETSLGPGRPPARPPCISLSPTVDKNKRSPPLSQSPGSAARHTPRVLPVPLEHPPHEGRKGSSLVSAPPPLAGAREAPGRRPARPGKWPRDRYSGAAP